MESETRGDLPVYLNVWSSLQSQKFFHWLDGDGAGVGFCGFLPSKKTPGSESQILTSQMTKTQNKLAFFNRVLTLFPTMSEVP